jgi:3-oxoacyl-[acyl-carrier protein] reductase
MRFRGLFHRSPPLYHHVMTDTQSFHLDGTRALVCGGSRGIGLAAAVELAALGAEVVLLARDTPALPAARDALPAGNGRRHRAVAVDMGDLQALVRAVTTLAAEAGPVHVLINNSGGPSPGPITGAEWNAFPPAFLQHVGAAHAVTGVLLPGMKEAGYGRIINIISTSVKQPIPGLGVSNTVRGAMANWAKTLAAEVAVHGITVNNVLPGATRTERLESLMAARAAREGKPVPDVEAAMKAAIPARRFAEPQEIGRAIAFLASPWASYVTGINLPVDGGRTACL